MQCAGGTRGGAPFRTGFVALPCAPAQAVDPSARAPVPQGPVDPPALPALTFAYNALQNTSTDTLHIKQ